MFYDWQATFSRQTGQQGEICLVLGAKDIGKTFGLRLKCVERFLKCGELFVDISRTDSARKDVMPGYFAKMQQTGFFTDYKFKCEKNCGYIAKDTGKKKLDWKLICYFVALTNFQREKTRTFVKPIRFIFDEAVIDVKDRYHRYLKDEFFILANLLDSISRQQPDEDYKYYVYMLGNAVDVSCPYLRYNGITKIPQFGYHWYKGKTVLLHYVEPWDADERKTRTLVGRMLAGSDESKVVFDNVFDVSNNGEIARKPANARFAFAIKWQRMVFGLWHDAKHGLWYVTEKVPKDARNVYTLAKRDGTVNYTMLSRTNGLMQTMKDMVYIGALRYSSVSVREAFFEVLEFMGVK